MSDALYYEVNFLTEDDQLVGERLCRTIKAEFDLIRSWQSMANLFGYEARKVLDNYIALSLRKLLCDKESLILKICPSFKMPPLTGKEFRCPGEEGEMQLVEINPDITIEPESKWIPLVVWLNEKIAWIEKDVTNIPDAYSNMFYSMLSRKMPTKKFTDLFECKYDGNDKIWCLRNPQSDKQKIYEMLKDNGYYDLKIRTLIKHIADKYGAHLDDKKSVWIRMANQSSDMYTSAISAFATQMIYVATKQIEGLSDYFSVPQQMEKHDIVPNMANSSLGEDNTYE